MGGHDVCWQQGDQITVSFRLLGDCLLWAFFLITDVAQIFVLHFPPLSYAYILAKMGWVSFWAIFHTLVRPPWLRGLTEAGLQTKILSKKGTLTAIARHH
jgi:hypothetical protein